MKKYALAAALCLLIASMVQYALFFGLHPEGLVFNSLGEDEALFVTAIKLSEFGYESPWTLESDGVVRLAFLNPANGPVFMLFPISVFYAASGISALGLFALFKLFSAALMLAAIYLLVRHFDFKSRYRIFILLVLSAGFGGLIHLVSSFFYPDRLLYPQSLFGFGVSIFRFVESYQAFSLALGLMSLLFFVKKRILLSSAFLGFTVLVYPFHGISFFIVMAIYCRVFSLGASHISKVFAALLAFSSVWAFSYFFQPVLFDNYANAVGTVSVNVLPSVLLGLGPLFIFLLYDMKKRFPFVSERRHLAFFLASFALMSYYQISSSVWAPPLPSNPLFVIFSVPFLAFLGYLAKKMLESGHEKRIVFMYAWFVVFLFIVVFPVKIFSVLPPKVTVFLYFPLAFLAYEGMKKSGKVFIAVVAVSALSIFFFYSFEQMDARDIYDNGTIKEQNFFYTEPDIKALGFLKGMPAGNAISSQAIGTYLPYYSGKKSLLFGTNRGDIVLNVGEKLSDYRKFYSSPDRSVLEKYGIRYVFYGTFEKRLGDLGSPDYLRKVYSDGTEIYEFIP